MQSDNEDEIDELMNDCDTEFIPPEEIELTWNPDNTRDLTLEGNAHLVDQGAGMQANQLASASDHAGNIIFSRLKRKTFYFLCLP